MMNEAEAKDRLIDVMRENTELRARVSEIEVRYDSVTISLKEKCAELAGLRNEYVEVVDELAAIKPAWSNAPEWAKWLSMDIATRWWWYECEPEQRESGRIFSSPNSVDMGAMDCRWRDTLEHRPEES